VIGPSVHVGELALNDSGAFKIGPFGSSLKKTELVKSGIPVAGIENVLPNKFVKGFRRFITAVKFEELSDYEILPDDVLVTTMGTIGRAASAPPDIGRVIFDSHLFRMRVDTRRVFPPYLCYALNSDLVASQLSRMARGAIMEGLNTKILRECSIPLPEMSAQRRIAEQLEQADRLRRTRRYVLELTDTFLPAAFLKFFGDPAVNPRGWEPARVCELGDVETGNTPSREIADYYGSAIEWIKSDNISLAQMRPAKATEGLSEKGIEVGRTVEAGSLLLTCIAGSETSIGNVVLTDRQVAFNQQINAVTPHRDVDPHFLYGLFLVAKPLIQRNTTLAMKRMITKGKLEELVLIKPPLTLQQEFAALVERLERLRAVQREALRQAEHLFASLLDRAFSG
jgi:type I restriction enzyme S subunit